MHIWCSNALVLQRPRHVSSAALLLLLIDFATAFLFGNRCDVALDTEIECIAVARVVVYCSKHVMASRLDEWHRPGLSPLPGV